MNDKYSDLICSWSDWVDHMIEQGPERGLRRCLGRYFSRNSSCLVLSAPRRFDRMSSTASSYVMPSSIRANATITGALPKPATQWIATQVFGFERNCSFSRLNHWSRISGGGVWPSGNAASCNILNHFSNKIRMNFINYAKWFWIMDDFKRIISFGHLKPEQRV